jgi:hypothetical protein
MIRFSFSTEYLLEKVYMTEKRRKKTTKDALFVKVGESATFIKRLTVFARKGKTRRGRTESSWPH